MPVDIVCQCGQSARLDEENPKTQPHCRACGKTLSSSPLMMSASNEFAVPVGEEATIDSRVAPQSPTETPFISTPSLEASQQDDAETTFYSEINNSKSQPDRETAEFDSSHSPKNEGHEKGFEIGEARVGGPPVESSSTSDTAIPEDSSKFCTHAERLLNADPFYRITRAKRSKTEKADSTKGFVYGIHRIIRSHVKGGMGMVHIAYDQFLKREVALKELFRESTTDESIVHRFIVEAEITAQLEHPGIVPIHSLGLDLNGNPYYTMKLIRGRTFQEAIKQYFKNPSEQELKKLVRRFVSVCQTMSFVHDRGVIHRDLKPANIMLSDHGETLVMDWGIAKTYNKELASGTGITLSQTNPTEFTTGGHSRPDLTLAGTVVGTPAFMSPEQASPDSQEVGPISDIFSLGAILFYLLTGRNAYTGKTSQEILTKVLTSNPPRPSDVARNIPPGLEAICMKAMCRHPKGRYQTASEMVVDLCNWLDGEPISAMKETVLERTWRYFRKNRQMSMSVFLMMFILFIILTLSTILVDRGHQRAKFRQMESQAVLKRNDEIGRKIGELDAQLKTVREECEKYRRDRDSTTTVELRTGYDKQLNEALAKASTLDAQIGELVRFQRELRELNQAIQREK